MQLHFHQPAPPLDRFVERVTYFSDYSPGHHRERLLPDGAVEIIIDLTETPKRLFDRSNLDRFSSFRHAWISGMRSQWIVIEATHASSMAVIRFTPGGAYRVLGFSVDAITDEVDQLNAVLGVMTAELRDGILEATDIPAKMAVIDRWLSARIRGRVETNPLVEYVTGRLFLPAGIRVRDVVDEIGYTQRYLLKVFREWVGMTPKSYARIRRFQQVLSCISADAPNNNPMAAARFQLSLDSEPDWADLANACGYYDQSHLIHDFNELAGMTPNQYFKAFRGLENYLPMD